METWPLPEEWAWFRLQDIAPAEAEQIRPADYPTREFTYIGLADVPNNGWLEPEPAPIKGAEVRSNCVQFGPRHVLYSKLRPYLNKVVVPTSDGVATTELVPLVPDQSKLTREFLAWYLRSPRFVNYAVQNSTGARMPRTRMSALWDAPVPIPPLDVQQRIVARIEALFAELAAARRTHAALVHDAERVMEAALADIFDEIPSSSSKTLNEITQITSGGTPLRSRSEYYKGEIPWVKTGELNDDIVLESEEHITEQAIEDSNAKLFPVGTLLIAMYGQGKTRGRTGILGIPATTNQACCAIFPEPEVFLPRYLQFWFRSMYRDLRQQSEMRGGNQPNLNAGMIKTLRPPLPKIPEQHRIVAYLDEVQAHAAELQRTAATLAADLDWTEQAILAQAFRGKL